MADIDERRMAPPDRMLSQDMVQVLQHLTLMALHLLSCLVSSTKATQ